MFWFLPVILGSALAGIASGAVIALICDVFIDEDSIKQEINGQEEFKKAFKAIIKSKSVKKVNLHIFDNQNDKLGSFDLTSEKGVSDNLQVDQVIYL